MKKQRDTKIIQEIQTLLWLADADGTTGGFVSVSGFLSSVAMVKKPASTAHNSETHKKPVLLWGLLQKTVLCAVLRVTAGQT